jgi:nucleoside transporter
MTPTLYLRLATMVFLHYFVWSCWYNTMAVYLGKLEFTGTQIGLAYGTTAIGALVSPFLIGVIADRFFPTQRVLAVLHLLGAGLLWLITKQTEFGSFYGLLIAYTVTYMAGHALINSLTLQHASNKAFPVIMTSASIGWISANFVINLTGRVDNSGMFALASAVALAMGIYSFTLPHTPPKGDQGPVSFSKLLGLDALRLLKDRSFAVFMICSFLICIPLSFYFTWTGAFIVEVADKQLPSTILASKVGDLGVYELIVALVHNIFPGSAKMSLGQISEIGFLLLLPLLLARFGAKKIMIFGMIAWAVRFAIFALFNEEPTAVHYVWALLGGILLHGMCYDFIFVMGRMYVDRFAGETIRASAQGLHAVFTLGAGMFVGSWLSGVVGQHYTNADKSHNWTGIWLVPAVMALLLVPAFLALFREKPADTPSA